MTTMTVQDVITRVQRQFGDESGVQVTNADVIRWINDCTRETVSQHENLFQNETFINSVAGTQTYSFASTVHVISSVHYKHQGDLSYYPLRFLSSTAFNEYLAGYDGTDLPNDVPLFYTRGNTVRTLRVFPAPSTSETNGIKVVSSIYGSDIDDVNDVLPLPEYYHQMTLEYCLMKAYEMDEDWEAADKKAAYVQSTLDFHNNQESWFGRETYPSVVATSEDYYD